MASSSRSSSSSSRGPVMRGDKRHSTMTASTPKKRIRHSPIEDLDISNITCSEDNSISDTMTESFLYEVDVVPIQRLNVKSKEFNTYNPKKKQRLFSKLLQNYDRVEEIAITWMNMYKEKGEDAKLTLLQLIVDVMGFENVNVENDFKPENLSNLVKILATKSTSEHKCILNCRTKFGKNFMNVFLLLFKHIIYLAQENHYLYDIFQDIISFFTYLSRSTKRVLVFSSTVLATKFCTEFLKILKEETNKVMSETDLNQSHNENGQYLQILNNIIEVFTIIYKQNCCLYDKKLFYLREICAEEMLKWINLCSDHFIKNEYLKLIGNLIVDENKFVRIATLKTVLSIVKEHKYTAFTCKCRKIMQLLFDTLKKLVSLDDVDTRRISIKIFTYSITEYPDVMNDQLRNYIFLRIYAKDYRVAKESGLFYNTYIKSVAHQNELKGVLMMANYPQMRHRLDILIETLFENTESLKNIGGIISILKDEQLFDYDDRILLFEILYNVVYILLNGRGTFTRDNAKIDINIQDNNNLIITNIIPNLNILLDSYDDSDEAIVYLLKTVLLINFNENSLNRYRGSIINAMNEMLSIIQSNINQDVISLISQIFAKLMDRNCPFDGIATSHFKIYIEIITKKYQDDYFHLNDVEVTRELWKVVRNDLDPLSVIMEHHNCTNNLDWDNIFLKWEMVDLPTGIIKLQMKCCLWFLIWEVKNLLNGEIEYIQLRVETLQKCINDYLSSLILILKNINISSLQFTAFNCISDLCKEFNKLDMEGNIEYKDNLKDIQINLLKFTRSSNVLTQLVIKICFEEQTETLANRKKILVNFVALLCLEQINTEQIYNILKYYILFKDEYQSIFDLLINQVSNESMTKAIVLLYVLTEVYLENRNHSETKKFAKLFSTFLSKHLFFALVYFAISFVSNDVKNIPFLSCTTVFAEKLSAEDKHSIILRIKSRFPPAYLQHDNVLSFIKMLKGRKAQETTTASRSVRSTSESSTRSSSIRSPLRIIRHSRITTLSRLEEEST